MARLPAVLLLSVLATWAIPAEARAPTGELVLDMADPIVVATVAGVPLRLRIGLDQKEVIELNPATVARLPIAFGPGFIAEVGRVSLPGIDAVADVTIGGRKFPAQLASHGRDCCAGVDGSISPLLLPYARIRFVRQGAPAGLAQIVVAMAATDDGLEYRVSSGGLRVQFSLDRTETVATSSAGAILARSRGGRFIGNYQDVAAAFGVMRPTRVIKLAAPATLAGFRFDTLRVRTADFGGYYELPRDAAEPGDIVVSKRIRPQPAVPIVLVGRDRLDRCAEIMFDTASRQLALRCRFGAIAPAAGR